MRPASFVAGFAFAAVFATGAQAGNTQYDFNQVLSQPNPLAGPAPATPPAPRSLITPLSDRAFTGTIYNMKTIDGSSDLAKRGVARPEPGPTVPQPATPDSAFGGTLYDMRALMSRSNPFAGRGTTPVPAAMPAGGGMTAPAPMAQAGTAPSSGKLPPLEDVSGEDIGLAPAAETHVNDPLEPLNRFFFGFNEAIMTAFIGPLARGYNAAVPEVIRDGIRNFLNNLDAPVTFANDLLQFEPKRAGTIAARFAINTTVGVLGFIDVAEKWGFEKHEEDFGQTLAVWGVPEPFYLVLPVFGPSNPRDAIGQYVVDSYMDPIGWYLDHEDQTEAKWARTGMNGLVTFADLVDEIDELRASSVDFYGAMRSLYRQKRAADIANGTPQTNIPNFDIPPATRRSVRP